MFIKYVKASALLIAVIVTVLIVSAWAIGVWRNMVTGPPTGGACGTENVQLLDK